MLYLYNKYIIIKDDKNDKKKMMIDYITKNEVTNNRDFTKLDFNTIENLYNSIQKDMINILNDRLAYY